MPIFYTNMYGPTEELEAGHIGDKVLLISSTELKIGIWKG